MKVDKIATLTGHRDCVYALEGADEPHRFFSAGGDGLVVQWNLQNPSDGELIARVPASVYAIRYRRETDQLWVGQNFEGIHVIDLRKREEQKSLKLTAAAIFDIQFWDDYALVGASDGTLIVVSVPDLAVRKHLRASDKSVRCLALNPLRREVAVGYSDSFIRVFSLDDFRLKHAFEAHANSVFTLAYAPDYRYLLSGSRDAHLKIWNAEPPYALHQSIVAHTYAINHVTYRPDGRLFATGSMDKSIKVWDAHAFRLLKVIDRARHAGHGTSVNKLLWTEYANQLVSGSDDRTLSVWETGFE
ncbi:MAG: WD40 repeat domain-containing protein [Ferruginibacter sp.]|nr:WD40 repeat domain-containing protein [Cytophagales bacterium]